MPRRLRHSFAVLLLVSLATIASAQDAKLKSGDYVAVIGDSITEQQQYSVFIQDYLLMCRPAASLQAGQFGWGGETAPGFANRMANDMLRFKPSVATTCFGMNDGGYSPQNPEKAKRYRDGQTSIVKQLKAAGVRFIVVGSPGVHDAPPDNPSPYNKTLADERDIARDVAKEEGVVFANVFDPMFDVMIKGKQKYGSKYHVAGGDRVHPDKNGHLVMAYAFLKALGCDGAIGTITVDLASGQAEATDGHKVLSAKDGQVEIESSRYPFCFYGDPASPSATRGVIEFFPFNDDLNRFKLVVKNAKSKKLRVTWGKATKEFTAEQLAAGINLAAEFLDNPFSEPFAKVEGVIRSQQNMEVGLVKSQLHSIPEFLKVAPGEKDSLERIAAALVDKDRAAREKSTAAVQPVKHTLKIEAVE